jgi:hypothetical protein
MNAAARHTERDELVLTHVSFPLRVAFTTDGIASPTLEQFLGEPIVITHLVASHAAIRAHYLSACDRSASTIATTSGHIPSLREYE